MDNYYQKLQKAILVKALQKLMFIIPKSQKNIRSTTILLLRCCLENLKIHEYFIIFFFSQQIENH